MKLRNSHIWGMGVKLSYIVVNSRCSLQMFVSAECKQALRYTGIEHFRDKFCVFVHLCFVKKIVWRSSKNSMKHGWHTDADVKFSKYIRIRKYYVIWNYIKESCNLQVMIINQTNIHVTWIDKPRTAYKSAMYIYRYKGTYVHVY